MPLRDDHFYPRNFLEYEQDAPTVLDDLAGFKGFIPNFMLWALLDCDAQTILLVGGNQLGKTSTIMMHYILRIMGKHPVEKKNIRPNTQVRVIRFSSVNLPMEKNDGEIRNTIYPQLKNFLPPSLVKKDITARRPAITIKDPQGGKNVIGEFVSYNQKTQSQAGVQRFSVFLDEESPYEFYKEQIPRLLASGGDLIIGCTPVTKMTWIYEEIYEKAKVIYNSPTIIDYLKKRDGITHPVKEFTDSKSDIAVIRAATDDNPTLDKREIDERYASLDRITLETRRYGIFHSVSGVVHKNYDPTIHFIDSERYFPKGVPRDWIHARGVDFHERNDWACGFICLSPQDEAFIYKELSVSPEIFDTESIAEELVKMSKDYIYRLNMIDPRAAIKQTNTRFSALDVMNDVFLKMNQKGVGTGGYWQAWDNKSKTGRDIIKQRLGNARRVGKPFNNEIHENGSIRFLPTLWILDTCPETNHSFKNWKWQQWATDEMKRSKDEKEQIEVRFSHFPITYECIFKHYAFSLHQYGPKRKERKTYQDYFNARA